MKLNSKSMIALVIFVGTSAMPIAYSQNVTPVTDPVVQIFAKKEGLTADEADKRLRLRIAAGEELQKILDEMPDRFAGKTFTESPMVVTIRMTGADPVPSRIVDTPYGRVTYHFVVGAAHSLNELHKVVESGRIQKMFPEYQGIMVDGERGVIVVELPGKDFENIYEGEALGVRRLLSVPIELKKAAAPVKLLSAPQVRAGGRAVFNNSYCTFAFRAYDSAGNPGLITAAHCEPKMRYEPVPGSGDSISNSVVLEVDPDHRRFDAGHDVQWHPVPVESGFETSWTIFTSLNNFDTVAYLGGVRPDILQAGFENFLILCHRGTRTGYSCGTLTSVKFTPAQSNCNNQSCTDDWVRVDDWEGAYDLLCDEGDSGGPLVTVGLDAVGIVSSASTAGSQVGDCKYLVAMSLAKVKPAIGVEVR